uniref:Uncharacterized protein n=1 Tax=Parascaris equorum TaxID=6256 RepID=A0A914R8I0_PAREQ
MLDVVLAYCNAFRVMYVTMEMETGIRTLDVVPAEDEEKRRQMEELLEEDAAWIVNTLMVKLVSHEEPDEALFLVHFCQDALRLFSYHLGTYPHSTRFKRIVADSIVVLTSKKTPAVFIISVLKTLKNLCRAAGGLDDEELVLETIVPLTRSCLLWMSERIDDDDFDVKARYSVLKFVLTHFFISGHFNDCDPLSVVAWRSRLIIVPWLECIKQLRAAAEKANEASIYQALAEAPDSFLIVIGEAKNAWSLP